MRRIRPMRSLGPAALAALATVLVVATPGGAAPTPGDVIVRNTAANPIPVTQQGTASVNVTNNSLPVQVQGTAGVNVTNSSLPVQVQGDVDVNESPTAPISTREAPVLYSDTIKLDLGPDDSLCEPIDLANGRAVRLESILVSGGNPFVPGVPKVWIRLYSEVSPPNDLSAIDLHIPLREYPGGGGFVSEWDGQLLGGFPIVGGAGLGANGKLQWVHACMQTPTNAGARSVATINLSGVYLDG